MSVLLVGPWIGEFGFELMRWQGIVRNIATSKKYDEVIIGTRKGNELIYQDFATDFIHVDIGNAETNSWFVKGNVSGKNWISHGQKAFFTNDIIQKYKSVQMINPSPQNCVGDIEQKFLMFGDKNEESQFNILIHARNTNKWNTGNRNWPIKKWEKVVNSFPEIRFASIGLKNGSSLIRGTEDLRGIPLNFLVAHMSSSKLCIGPSSGPMHLSSLCGCPHIVWCCQKKWDNGLGGKCRVRDFYSTLWNPFNTPSFVLDDDDWQPSVELVVNVMRKVLEKEL